VKCWEVTIHVLALVLAPDAFTAGLGAVIGLAILGAAALSTASAIRVVRALRR